MAIAGGSGSTSDYKLAVNQILYYMDQNFGGIDHNGLFVYAKMNRADFQWLLQDYFVYKQGRLSLPLDDSSNVKRELYPNAHDVDVSTWQDGGVTEKDNPVRKASDF